MINWIKTGRTVTAEGTTITYEGAGLVIESRKRHIPHTNRSGTWDHTTYFVMKDGVDLKELYSLKDAKEYTEKLIRRELDES